MAAQCEHIQLVQKERGHSFNDGDPIQLEPSKLEDLAIPLRYKSQMLSLYQQCPHLVQKVASETFAIRCSQESQEYPLGLVHVHLQRRVTAGPTPQKYHNPFHCPCNSFRQYTRHFPGSSSTAKPSPRCIHFYLCIWAVASDIQLQQDFPFTPATVSPSCMFLTAILTQ